MNAVFKTSHQKHSLFEKEREYQNFVKNFIESMNYGTVTPNFIDVWKDRKLYGRVNELSEVVVPKMEKILPVTINAQTFVGIPFVIDAFIDFYSYYQSEAQKHGWVNIDLFFSLANFKDVFFYYRNYLYTIVNSYSRINMTLKRSKFFTFFDFVEDVVKNNKIILFEDFVVSPLNPYTTSGLFFQLFSYPIDNFEIKEKKFFSQDFFRFYCDAARRFGFLIEKNMPWFIVFDINSPAFSYYYRRRQELDDIKKNKKDTDVQKFLEKYDTSADNYMQGVEVVKIGTFFQTYFDFAKGENIDFLVEFFRNYFISLGREVCDTQDVWLMLKERYAKREKFFLGA